MKKLLLSSLILIGLTSCSELMLLTSTGGVVISNNMYAKAYNGIDFLTIIQTEKDIKKHIYERITGPKRED